MLTSPILMPSPVQCSPLVVGRCSKSGLYCANRELLVKSAPKPPQISSAIHRSLNKTFGLKRIFMLVMAERASFQGFDALSEMPEAKITGPNSWKFWPPFS